MEACAIEWITIPAPDLDAAERFYSGVFGFEISEFSSSFRTFKAKNLSGGLNQDLEVASGGIGFSATVPDLKRALELVLQYGGELIKEPCSLGDGAGFYAVIADPNRNQLEVYCASAPSA